MSFNTYNQPEVPNTKTSNAMSPNKKKIKDVITEYNLSLRRNSVLAFIISNCTNAGTLTKCAAKWDVKSLLLFKS